MATDCDSKMAKLRKSVPVISIQEVAHEDVAE
jgi:hypothetical protein